MSLSLIWTRNIKSQSMDTATKWVLEKAFTMPYTLTSSNIPILQGILLGTNNKDIEANIKELIEAIEKYDEITLRYES